MPFLDTIQNTFNRVLPEKQTSLPLQPSTTGGIGSGHAPFEDDLEGYLVFLLFIPVLWTIWIWMIVSKPAIIFYSSQAFFNFLALCCFASVASFQAKWGVGPSGLSGFAIFIAVIGILFSLFLLFVPVVYEKYDKGARLARALKEVRVSFIMAGAGTTFSLLIAFIVTISAWTEPGCKDATKDPHADKGADFRKGLDGWCSTKKAAGVFFWFTFGFWLASLILTILDWRNGGSARARDPPFTHPSEDSEGHGPGDEESIYDPIQQKVDYESNNNTSPFSDNNRYSGVPSVSAPSYNTTAPSLPRPSVDAYGAFSDPPPTGFGASGQPRPSIDTYGAFSDPAPSGFNGAPGRTSPQDESPRVSRTMQYADPYAAVRATIAGAAPSQPAQSGYR